MSTPVSSLPENWVERIWSTMRGVYGAAFDRQWECPAGIEPKEHVRDLKAIWGRELRGFQQNPRAIAHALDHLPPDFPPNLLQFAALCRRAPRIHVHEALEAPKDAPKADQAVIAQVLEAVRPNFKPPRAWIARVQERIDRGETVSIAVQEMRRNAMQAPSGGSDL